MGKDTLTLAMSGVFTLIMHTRMNTQDVNSEEVEEGGFSSWSDCQGCFFRECSVSEIMGCQILGGCEA